MLAEGFYAKIFFADVCLPHSGCVGEGKTKLLPVLHIFRYVPRKCSPFRYISSADSIVYCAALKKHDLA